MTDYLETEALLLILQDEPDQARALLATCYPGELKGLRLSLRELVDMIDDLLNEKGL